jgi:hypothetical protein
MPRQARAIYTYDEVDSEALPVAERFALWRETGRLPMAAEPIDDAGRRQFRIGARRLSGPSGRFVDLTASPMKLSREKRHYACDRLDMVSLSLQLALTCSTSLEGPYRWRSSGPAGSWSRIFIQSATAWWRRPSRSLNLHLPRLTVEAAVGDRVNHLHGTVLSFAAFRRC